MVRGFWRFDEIDRFLAKPDINAQDPFLRQTALTGVQPDILKRSPNSWRGPTPTNATAMKADTKAPGCLFWPRGMRHC